MDADADFALWVCLVSRPSRTLDNLSGLTEAIVRCLLQPRSTAASAAVRFDGRATRGDCRARRRLRELEALQRPARLGRLDRLLRFAALDGRSRSVVRLRFVWHGGHSSTAVSAQHIESGS